METLGIPVIERGTLFVPATCMPARAAVVRRSDTDLTSVIDNLVAVRIELITRVGTGPVYAGCIRIGAINTDPAPGTAVVRIRPRIHALPVAGKQEGR